MTRTQLQRSFAGAEEITHQVLDRSGEQDAHARRALEDGAYAPGHRVRLAESPARHILELVQEQDHPPLVSLGEPLSQPESAVEGDQGLLLRPSEIEGELDVLAQILSRAQRGRGSQRLEDAAGPPETASAMARRIGARFASNSSTSRWASAPASAQSNRSTRAV